MKRLGKAYEETQVPVTEKTHKASMPLALISRALGLFPVSVTKTKTKIILKLSPYYRIYSYVMGFVLVIFTYYGLFEDIVSDKKNSVRIKSLTKACVVFFDVTSSQAIIIFAIFYSSWKLSKYFKCIQRLQETESILPMANFSRENKFSAFVTILLSMSALSVLLTDTLIYDLKYDTRMKWLLLKRYATFYITILVTVFAQYQIWFTCRSILRKLIKLNEIIKTNYFNCHKSGEFNTWSTSHFKFENVSLIKKQNVGVYVDFLEQAFKEKLNNSQISVKPFQELLIPKVGNILQLTIAYMKLWEAVRFLNEYCGPTVVAMIVENLWQLIQGPFYIIIDISQPTLDYISISLQLIWIIFAFGRLLLLVQPAHSCLLEVQETHVLIGKLLASKPIAEKFKSELDVFSNTLLHCPIEFSASGLTALSRSLVSSLLAAVTTYLVILVQYRNN